MPVHASKYAPRRIGYPPLAWRGEQPGCGPEVSDWTDGYRAALRDVEALTETRLTQSFPTRFREAVALLLTDLRNDAGVIEHEDLNRDQRAALDAERAAVVPRQGALL